MLPRICRTVHSRTRAIIAARLGRPHQAAEVGPLTEEQFMHEYGAVRLQDHSLMAARGTLIRLGVGL